MTEVGKRQADSSLNRITDSLGLRALITAKHVSTPQRLVKTGLEWSRPLQDNLTEEVAGVQRNTDISDDQACFRNKPFPAATLNWEQMQERGARIRVAWESAPVGHQSREGPIEPFVTTLRMTIKCAFSRMIRGERMTQSYHNLRTLLATMTLATKERHVAPCNLPKDCAPLVENQMLLRKMLWQP